MNWCIDHGLVRRSTTCGKLGCAVQTALCIRHARNECQATSRIWQRAIISVFSRSPQMHSGFYLVAQPIGIQLAFFPVDGSTPCNKCAPRRSGRYLGDLNLSAGRQVLYWGTSNWTAQRVTEAWEVARRLDLIGPTSAPVILVAHAVFKDEFDPQPKPRLNPNCETLSSPATPFEHALRGHGRLSPFLTLCTVACAVPCYSAPSYNTARSPGRQARVLGLTP